MKRVTIIISLCVASAFVSKAQDRCDTLKWKIIETYYADYDGMDFKRIDKLDSAVINIDTLPRTNFAVKIVNISNDIFTDNDALYLSAWTEIYTDTGIVGGLQTRASYSYFDKDCFPNDTINMMFYYGTDFLSVANSFKTTKNIELEEMKYWKFIIGVSKTTKDGLYSDSVIYAGLDTSTFYVVRGGVGIKEIDNANISVSPNPAQTQFTVSNTENADIQLYNILGQKVFQTCGTKEETVINTSSFPSGLYVLKIVRGDISAVRKVQIVR